MITETQRRNLILRRISRIPEEKLKELDDYLSKLEESSTTKSKTLSFAGSWQDIDETLFRELTSELTMKREENRTRIDEQSPH